MLRMCVELCSGDGNDVETRSLSRCDVSSRSPNVDLPLRTRSPKSAHSLAPNIHSSPEISSVYHHAARVGRMVCCSGEGLGVFAQQVESQ